MVKPTLRSLDSVTPAEHSVRSINRARLGDIKTSLISCKKPVWITCFFDGTGNNYIDDGNGSIIESEVSYSNVAKLWAFAHPRVDVGNRTHSFYIQGVGTPCLEVGDTGGGIDKATGMSSANKGQARIDWMLQRIKVTVDSYMPTVSCINIAVFGFSRGAAEARAFVRQIAQQCKQQGGNLFWVNSGGAPSLPKLTIYFLGLFDTVASVGFGGSRLEKALGFSASSTIIVPVLGPLMAGAIRAMDCGGHAAWANDLRIPAYVQQCEHYIAGHEVREKFPCDSVRENTLLPSNCREIVYPGSHSDVGGGYRTGEQEDRSNELSRIPLCNMYLTAYAAGVPFFHPVTVEKNGGLLFKIRDELKACFDVYMRTLPAADTLERQVISHMNAYYHWRWGRTLRQRERLKAQMIKPPLENRFDTPTSARTPDRFFRITDREWEEDVEEIAGKKTGYIRRRTMAHEDVIFDAWKGTLRKSLSDEDRKAFDLFFDRYVHDSVAGFKNQLSDTWISAVEWSRWARNRQYFVGKRGEKFLYWRYDGLHPASASAEVALLATPERTDGSTSPSSV